MITGIVRRPLVLLLVGVSLVAAACSYQPEIYNAVASGDGQTLSFSMNNCHGDYAVWVTETPNRVSVEITDNRSPIRLSGDDCADAVTVELTEPLGERHLVDGGGSTIDVTYYPWNQTKYTEAEYVAALEAARDCITKLEPDTVVTIGTHPDGYPYLDVDASDLGDGEQQIGAPASSVCTDNHVEPLTR